MIFEPATYLTEAPDYIQRSALRSRSVDWPVVRTEALARIQNAQTTADTYPTLRWVLSQLGDHHSFLLSPQSLQKSQEGIVVSSGLLVVYPEGVIVAVHAHSPAAQAGLQIRDTIETINGVPRTQLDRVSFNRELRTSPVSLTCRRAGQEPCFSVTLQAAAYKREIQPRGWQWGLDIGYLELPGVVGNHEILQSYAQTTQQLIRDMDQAGVCTWMIDLRRNMGGSMWPMLTGVQSLLGEGECGFFVSPSEKQTSWLPTLKKQTNALLGEPYRLSRLPEAIAVLTSRLTCSAGEFTTLAFTGHPQTRSFGEPTVGLHTANTSKKLRDGPVVSDWTLFQTEDDPVVSAAIDGSGVKVLRSLVKPDAAP